MKKKRKRKRKKSVLPFKIISILLLLVSITFLIILAYSDLLPIKYFSTIIISIVIFNILNIFLLNLKKLKRNIKKVISVFVGIIIIILSIGSTYLYKTTSVLIGNGDTKYKIENYSVIVLANSKYESIKNLKGNIGYYENSINSDKAKNSLNKIQKFNYDGYTDANLLISDLVDSKITAILLEDSIKNLLTEENSDFIEKTKTIYNFKIKVASESTVKEVNVTKQPFVVYISGIDTYGEIASVSRSDVNIVAVINPLIKQVLLISIPRDYYVKLHGTKGYNDKLTHAGIYGIDMSIKTIEDLLDIDINYYVKVNFTSVIDIVNALGGLDVYSEYTFTSYSGYYFTKGMNKVNGEQALDFARTRKAFANGDRQRGINQQAIIEAAVRKATSKAIITKYTSLLNSIDGKYQTNIGYKKITALIKMQLNDMSPWNITSYSLTGSDSSNYTYTYNQLLYVMEPDEKSILEAKELIGNVLKNTSLDNSYKNISENSKKVSETKKRNSSVNTKTEPKKEENKRQNENENEISIDDNKESPIEQEQIEVKEDNNTLKEDDEKDILEEITPIPDSDKTNSLDTEKNENNDESNIIKSNDINNEIINDDINE